MNYIVEEMLNVFISSEDVNTVAKDILVHYGMPRRSGRYPWGSGDDPYQHGRDFLGRVEELKKRGWQETPENIKKEFGLSTTEYRIEKSVAKDERRMLNVERARALKDDGLGYTEIGKKMGVNESTVRGWFEEKADARMRIPKNTAEALKKIIKEKGMIDVGVDVERELNITRNQLDSALYLLKREGYEVYGGRVPQATNKGAMTTLKVLCPPGTEHKEIFQLDKINSVKDYITRDGGETFEKKFHYPESMDRKRIKVLYGDEKGIDGQTGNDKDGIIEIRRGVKDLSLGESRYAQVRILIDGKMYAKGMAVYSDNVPDGYDMVFNTNKKKGTPDLNPDPNGKSVFKKIKDDPENPFGSLIKDADKGGQYWYEDPKTGEKKLGLINKRSDQGDWTEWKDALPSQFLSKQSLQLAKKQLGLAKADKLAEYDDICSINNPTIQKHFLKKFSDECDAAAVSLQAAALPGQKYHVIIPVNTLKENEVFAPGYENGTKLALVRYPHGGTFEIPIVIVNNKHKIAKDLIGMDSVDAIGIHKKVADRLSGADFDGDTVMCIPTHDKGGKVKIASKDTLEGLVGFDPKESYPYHEGMKIMKDTGKQMGVITNLITDMTIAKASDDEIAAAVRHSMVVIDAEKHKLDYKQSEIDNNIAALKDKYQNGGGASTIISRAKGKAVVDKRQGSPHINMKENKDYDPSKPEGSLIWKTSDNLEYSFDKIDLNTGKTKHFEGTRKTKITQMEKVDDAMELVSPARHPIEIAYAEYANSMKSLANTARKRYMTLGERKGVDPTAKKVYSNEVRSLDAKLNVARKNAPKERYAQIKANAEVTSKKAKYKEKYGVDPKPKDVKKWSQQALNKYRSEIGSVARRDRTIKITDKEWEAIQVGAISKTKLTDILNNTDADDLRQRATPKSNKSLSKAQVNRIKQLAASNYTIEEIARKMGKSPSTVSKYLKGE